MKKGESPLMQIRRRFKKNKTAVIGWYIIVIAFLLAVFAYMIIPDKTPFANRMNLTVSNKPPGFRIKMMKVPKSYFEKKNFISRILYGKNDEYDFIPFQNLRIENADIYYTEYIGDEDFTGPEKKIALSRFDLAGKKDIAEQITTERTFYFGTDRYGRDMLSRLIAGTRVTFSVGFAAVIISLFLGVLLGSLAGFFRGWVDSVIVWLINVVWSVPTLLLVITITLVLGKGFEQVFIAVGLTMWVDVARIVRSQVFSIRELEYVHAGKAMGFRNPRIIAFHMLPNVIGPVLVIAASNFSTAILLEAGLSFLGIGAQPPMPSWGAMIKENYNYIIIPGSAYLAILPGLAIMLLTMAFTFVANGLRDAIDSKAQVTLS